MSRFGNLNPYDLHKHLVNDYILKRTGDTSIFTRDTSKDRTDADVLRENHKFLWDEDDDDNTPGELTWEQQFARKYYDKLFKEYCVCDLSRYKENKVALRWRTEKEVIDGKGQFICGHKICTETLELRSWEVNFAYVEHGERKNALIKVRLCPGCSSKLNYRSKKREIKNLKKSFKRMKKAKKRAKKLGITLAEDDIGESSTMMYQSDDSDSNAVESDENKSNEAATERPEESAGGASGEQCWSKSRTVEEKSREEEFDEYLEDLLL